MKTIAIAVAAVAFSYVIAFYLDSRAAALDSGPARIRLTADLVETRWAGGGEARTYALFNRPAYPDRLGTAVMRCVQVSKDYLDCTQILRLSRGTIIARSLVPKAAAFRLLGIVGGTGYYANSGGEMTVQPLGDAQLILVNILGY